MATKKKKRKKTGARTRNLARRNKNVGVRKRKLGKLSARVSRLEGQMKSVTRRVGTLETKHDRLAKAVAGICDGASTRRKARMTLVHAA
jgi:hypothetical protein